jgi:hypothetical protein
VAEYRGDQALPCGQARGEAAAAALDGRDAAQDLGGGDGRIGMAETVAARDESIAGTAKDAMDDEPAMALKHHHLAGLDEAGGAADFEEVARLHAGEHAAAGDWQTSLAERS